MAADGEFAGPDCPQIPSEFSPSYRFPTRGSASRYSASMNRQTVKVSETSSSPFDTRSDEVKAYSAT